MLFFPTRGRIAFAFASVLAAILFVRLGFWQLDRHAEMRNAAAVREARLARPPVAFDSIASLASGPSEGTDLEWSRVILAGSWDYDGEILVRNRGLNGRPGVHVVTPLLLAARDPDAADRIEVLVLRGWLPAPDAVNPGVISTSDSAPELSEGRVAIIRSSREGAGQPIVWTRDGPVSRPTFAAIDVGAIRSQGADDRAPSDSTTYLPFFVQLLPNSGRTGEGDLETGEPVPVPLPEPGTGPHLAYAVQWFSFAAIVLIGTGAYLSRPPRGRRDASVGTGMFGTPLL